jgi:hypothetical protein
MMIKSSKIAFKSIAEIPNHKDIRPPIPAMYRMKEYLGIALYSKIGEFLELIRTENLFL